MTVISKKGVFLLVFTLTSLVMLQSAWAGQIVKDHDPTNVITIVDAKGKVLSQICHGVSKGDYLITEDNTGYTITEVKGKKAYAKSEGKVDLNAPTDNSAKINLGTAMTNLWTKFSSAVGLAKGPQVIGIYHTHSDESYQPTSGVANEDKGDIYRVGAALKKALEAKGFKVIQSQNNHNPHDAMAYTRSRRTATQMLTQYKPVALIDVHRDAIPDPNYYQLKVSGEEIAASRIVVGKQNATRSTNFDFAKRIKAVADKKHPGLVKEIFWGHGNYNQDQGPNTILLEFGTHTNPEVLANKGADLMADVLPVAITGSETSSRSGGRVASGGGPWRTLLIVLGVVALLAVGFVAMNRGGVEFLKKGGSSTAGFLGDLDDKKKDEQDGKEKRKGKRL